MKIWAWAIGLLAVLSGVPLILIEFFGMGKDCDSPCGSDTGIVLTYVWAFVLAAGVLAVALYLTFVGWRRLRRR